MEMKSLRKTNDKVKNYGGNDLKNDGEEKKPRNQINF